MWQYRFITFGIVLLLFVAGASDYLVHSSLPAPFSKLQAELIRFLSTSTTQRWAVVGFLVYWIAFAFIRQSLSGRVEGNATKPGVRTRDRLRLIFLSILVAIGSARYATQYDGQTSLGHSPVLFFAVAMGWAAASAELANRSIIGSVRGIRSLIVFLTLCLVVTSAVHPELWRPLSYREVTRWRGPWESPNVYGILMGIGVVLGVGQLLFRLLQRKTSWRTPGVFAILAGVAMMSAGLVMSFSRGAWLATAVASCWLLYQTWFTDVRQRLSRLGRSGNRLAIAAIVISIFVLGFWNLRHSEQPMVRRSFSGANLNDFSWRNRITTYIGALEIMADRPLWGVGWNQTLTHYEQFHKPASLMDGRAIWSNDYLMLGTAVGVPALGCFIAYLILSMRGMRTRPLIESESLGPSRGDIDFWKMIARAAVLALLICFWFDGGFNAGMFVIATAVPFWVLLEVGYGASATESSGTYAEESFFGNRLRRRWNSVPKNRRSVFLGTAALLLFLLLVPAAQVTYVRFSNPAIPRHKQTKTPANGETVETQKWQRLSDTSLDFLTCVWISEDSRFFRHNGFDWQQIMQAYREAQRTGQPSRGASTITQQCARSLFLWQGRSWVRKGLEAYYTIWMELLLSKRRILELYINVIEMGDGIYGIERAAQHYYGVSSADLSREQAAMLVAIMPSPKQWDPLNPNERVQRRFATILQRTETALFPMNVEEKKQ